MTHWFCNGQAIDSLPIDDRAIHYGDGLFETIAIRNGEPRLWSLHIERLHSGCDRLGLDSPADESLRVEITAAMHAAQVDPSYALAKLIITAGSSTRGYRRPISVGSRVLTGVSEAQRPAADNYQAGVVAVRCTTTVSEQPTLAGLKTLNRLEQVLARNERSNTDAFEGLMCDADGRLICGTMSNVFVVHDQSVSTPALDRCGVAGVMRQHVLNTLKIAGHEITEKNVSWDHAMAADELFLTNSQFGLVPIQGIDEQRWRVGPVTGKVMKLLAQNGIEECS